ncbi:membrane protein [Yimella radicis]
MTSRPAASLHADLVAVVVSVGTCAGAPDQGPMVLAAGDPLHLPAGPLRTDHHSLQNGARAFVAEQTGHSLGFVEQLYTFADLGRDGSAGRAVSISYLGLTRAAADDGWRDVYDLLPWEDRRSETSIALCDKLMSELRRWSTDASERIAHIFGDGELPWRPELALQRYELLWEAGLVADSPNAADGVDGLTGPAMHSDHRRILATGLSRLRSTIQYRPLVFELMPPTFTLGELQAVVEALVGAGLHKQNFRRSVEQQALVEPTDDTSRATGGRPARLYRFRREAIAARGQVGTKVPIPRSR